MQRYALAGILHAIHCTWDRGYARARSFRHLVVVATVLLTIGVAALVAVGVLWPHALPLCTSGTLRVCATGSTDPQPGDVALVALVGAIAAGFSAVADARLRPLVDPYRTPIVQGLLKVPTGAFTALLGVLAVEQGLQAGADYPPPKAGCCSWRSSSATPSRSSPASSTPTDRRSAQAWPGSGPAGASHTTCPRRPSEVCRLGADSTRPTGLVARLRPRPDHCRVRLEPAPGGATTVPTGREGAG